MTEKSIYDEMKENGISRRDFMKLCGLVSGALWLNATPVLDVGGKIINERRAR